MKCKKCGNKLRRKEFLADVDAENQTILSYTYCPVCHEIFSTDGNPLFYKQEVFKADCS